MRWRRSVRGGRGLPSGIRPALRRSRWGEEVAVVQGASRGANVLSRVYAEMEEEAEEEEEEVEDLQQEVAAAERGVEDLEELEKLRKQAQACCLRWEAAL